MRAAPQSLLALEVTAEQMSERAPMQRADLRHWLGDGHPPAAGHACRQALRIPGLHPEVELLGQILLELLENPPAKPRASLLKTAALGSNTQPEKTDQVRQCRLSHPMHLEILALAAHELFK